MRHLLAPFAVLALTAAAPAPTVPIVTEARAFMAAYAQDLAAGDRPAIAARYSRDGAHMLGFAAAKLESRAALTAYYAGNDWQPPAKFAWHDLSYEPIGRDAVAVIGGFDWTAANGRTGRIAYSALLRREGGALKIRLEHENVLAPPQG